MRLLSRARRQLLPALALALACLAPARGVSTADMNKCHAELGFTFPVSEILNCGVDMRHYVECLDTTHCKPGENEYNDALLEFRRVCCNDDTTCGHERFNELCGSRDFGGESPWWRIALITVVSCLGAVLLCMCCYCGISGAWRDVLWHGNGAVFSCSNWCAACWGWGPPPPPPYATQRERLMQPCPPPGYAYAAPPANTALPTPWFPSLAGPASASLVYAGAPGQPLPYPQYAQPPPPQPQPQLPPQYVRPPPQASPPSQINAQTVYLGQPALQQPLQLPPQSAYPQALAQPQIFVPR